MAHRGFVVSPLSRAKIRRVTAKLRPILECTDPYIDIVRVVDCTIPKMWPQFGVEILSHEEMGVLHALTTPGDACMKVREDVYAGAHDGVGRDRFTLAHELGHLLLHSEVQFARTWSKPLPIFQDSEWQANTFGGEFLMDYSVMVACRSIEEAMDRFGVSYDAARVQWEQLVKEGLVK